MNAPALITRLETHASVFQAILGRVRPEDAPWKPSPDKWSLLEVTAHLLDEEREDFRTRLDLTLHHPDADWPPIDPVGWVTARNYAARELPPTLQQFLEERLRSVAWLRGLGSPDWQSIHPHPAFGSMRAGDLLASWVAHDLLHIRQIARLHFQRVGTLAEPFGTGYAGEW